MHKGPWDIHFICMNKTIQVGITIYNLPQAPAVQEAPARN